jgi:hypothetical protein
MRIQALSNRLFRLGLVALTCLLLSVNARAQTRPRSLPDGEVVSNLRWIEGELSAEKSPSLWWWNGWLGIFSVLTVAQTTGLFITNDAELKQDLGVGAVESLLSTVGILFLTPLEAKTAVDALRALPASSPEERASKLAEAERLLTKSAEDEAFGRSWISHAVGIAVSLAGGLVIWQGFDRPLVDGLLNFGIGVALAEVQIFTQPVRLIYSAQQYQNRTAVRTNLMLSPRSHGIILAVAF